MRWRPRTRRIRTRPTKFFDLLSSKARFQFYAGVFFLFLPFTILYDLASIETAPWWETGIWSIFGGLVAVGWAFAFTRHRGALFLVIPASILLPMILGLRFWAQRQFPVSGLVEMAAALGVIIAAYVLFVRFIATEGSNTIRLRTEIGLAKQVHEHLVPSVDLRSGELEVFGVSAPTTEVGGDLLDVVQTDGTTSVYVADVSGHGVAAGVLMAMIKSAIHMGLLRTDSLDALVNDLNRVVSQVRKPGMFATFACLRFAGAGRDVEFCLAGHPPILHYRHGDNSLARISSEHIPLGILDDSPYHAGTVPASAGDLFVILTDGLTEVFDKQDNEFGLESIERLVAENAERDLSAVYVRILEGARSHGEQTDDQTLVVARVVAP